MAFVPGTGSQGQPFMTVSFKMDITTSGTHNGLFITTGIQNGTNTQMKGFGFIQPNSQNQLMDNPQLSIAPETPTPVSLLPQSNAPIETSTIIKEEMKEKTTTSFGSTSVGSILNESQSIIVSPPTQRKTTTFTAEPLISGRTETPRSSRSFRFEPQLPISQPITTLSLPQQTQRTVSPAPSLINRTADEFLRNVPFKINTFSEESRPFVQHPTDLVLNDTTTTTTTVEVFRANSDDPNVEYYKLPPPPADSYGLPQLISTRGPSYEVHTDTKTRFSDAPTNYLYGTPSPTPLNLPTAKSVQWDTREPITILKEEDDSRYGSHGSINTILRKQWIENKTETVTRAYSPTHQVNENSAPFKDSNRSLIDNSRESTSYTILETQTAQNQERRQLEHEKRQLEREYVTQVESAPQSTNDQRTRYYEKRRGSPHNSKSPVRYKEQPSNSSQQKAPTYISYPIETQKSRGQIARARQLENASNASKPRQHWEYSSHVDRSVGRQSRSGYGRQPSDVVKSGIPQKSSYTSSTIPQLRQRHRRRSAGPYDVNLQPNQKLQFNVPSKQDAEDFVERPPRQNYLTFNKPQVVTIVQPQQRSRSKTPPLVATEYGKPTLVYSPIESGQDPSLIVEDDYYDKYRQAQYQRGRTSSRRSVDPCDRSRSPSPWEWQRPESPNYRMGNRSASSNEIFKLYQTRDCFGNIINEMNRPTSQQISTNDPQIRSKAGRKERPISQHSYQSISQRNSQNLEDAKFDDYNNVRLVADGAKLHIVQEGKV